MSLKFHSAKTATDWDTGQQSAEQNHRLVPTAAEKDTMSQHAKKKTTHFTATHAEQKHTAKKKYALS